MSAELASTSAQLFAAATTRASSISQAQMPLSPAECVRIMGGGVGERLKPAVLKTVRPERVSGVRIPPPPPVRLYSWNRRQPPSHNLPGEHSFLSDINFLSRCYRVSFVPLVQISQISLKHSLR